uniref:Uncharacterized protein n=1 Tax=Haptolina brevifila TaxID=156173 RepID=A0A7S2GPH6_9EUKA|mmetsp:Transcript_44360/g.88665  ORF Transcript_44360/g.88665 Transcript_44360/m.88665 type:complete len:147 (+) Transcript_44360:423-863(+)
MARSHGTVSCPRHTGSVHVTVTIAVPDSSPAGVVTSALSSSTSNATALTALLDSAGVSITVDSITSSFNVVAPPPPSSSSGLSPGAIAGIVIGSVVGAMILLFICYKAFWNLADSPGGMPLVNRGYGEPSGGTVEITANKGSVDVI